MKGRKNVKDKAIKDQLAETTPRRPKKIFKGKKAKIHKLETRIARIEKHLRIMKDWKYSDDWIGRSLESSRQDLKKLRKELEELKDEGSEAK